MPWRFRNGAHRGGVVVHGREESSEDVHASACPLRFDLHVAPC